MKFLATLLLAASLGACATAPAQREANSKEYIESGTFAMDIIFILLTGQ
jgi:hypothetical protein